MATQTLTDSLIRNIKPDKRVEIFDSVKPGLALRVTPTGYKSFFFRYRYGGKIKRYTIGSYPAVSLKKARDKADAIRVQAGEGSDPQGAKRKAKQAVTGVVLFSDLCDRYSKRHLPTLREKTRYDYQWIIDRELLPKLGRLPVAEITRKHIVDLLDGIALDRKAPVLSNRVRAVLSSIFAFGIDKAIAEVNPVLHVKRKKRENRRDRVYTEDEIQALWSTFEAQAEPIQSLFKMLLICGQRSGETKRMKWQDISNGIWTIPAEQTKANRTHHVPLPEMAIELLERIKPLTGDSEYVFQSPTMKNQPVKWLQKASERIQKASGVSDFRPHDLRRCMASYTAGLGVDRTVLGKTLNHAGMAGDHSVTSVYDRHSYHDEKRKALNLWSRQLKRIITGKTEPAKIHAMR